MDDVGRISGKFITLWRKPAPHFLDWDFHVSLHDGDEKRVFENLQKQGIRQISTYRLGEHLPELSIEFGAAPTTPTETDHG